MKTLYEHAGGHDALYRFVDISYRTALADPLLQPLCGAGKPEHVDALTEPPQPSLITQPETEP